VRDRDALADVGGDVVLPLEHRLDVGRVDRADLDEDLPAPVDRLEAAGGPLVQADRLDVEKTAQAAAVLV